MKIKGHTKIELFNAETGELEQVVEENNMVTSAVQKLLNLPVEFVSCNTSIKTILDNTLPISTNAMGGVLLFSNKKEENSNLIYANGEGAVGHAGRVYSGTNPCTGTLNETECRTLSNGYRLVWDFATDRANGTIACVCLTSRTGGYIGLNEYWDPTADNYNPKITNFYNFDNDLSRPLYNLPKDIPTSKFGGIRGIVAKDTIVSLSNPSTTTFRLSYYKILNTEKIELNWGDCGSSASSPYKTQDISITNPGDYTSYTDSDGFIRCIGYGYQEQEDKIHYDIWFNCNRINALTGTVDLDKKILINVQSFPDDFYIKRFANAGIGSSNFYYKYNGYKPFCLMNNFIIAWFQLGTSSYCLATVDFNGNFIKKFDLTSDYDDRKWERLYDLKREAHFLQNNQCIAEDGDIIRLGYWQDNISNMDNMQIYTYTDIYPYFISHYNYYNAPKLYLNKDFTYSATINNLATPVTKTSAQTMKITYDLIES